MAAKPFSLPSASSSSYGGNPLAAAAALVTIQTILSDKLVENSARVGRLLRDGLQALATRHRSIANVRGQGLLIGFDLVSDQETKTLLPKGEMHQVLQRLSRRRPDHDELHTESPRPSAAHSLGGAGDFRAGHYRPRAGTPRSRTDSPPAASRGNCKNASGCADRPPTRTGAAC